MALNVALLRRIQKHILEEPKRFGMGSFYRKAHGRHAPACGTQACIAGWAVILGTPARDRAEILAAEDELMLANLIGSSYEVGRKAEKALGLNGLTATRLFYGQWPAVLRERFDRAKSSAVRARVAADAIGHLIAHPEEWE